MNPGGSAHVVLSQASVAPVAGVLGCVIGAGGCVLAAASAGFDMQMRLVCMALGLAIGLAGIWRAYRAFTTKAPDLALHMDSRTSSVLASVDQLPQVQVTGATLLGGFCKVELAGTTGAKRHVVARLPVQAAQRAQVCAWLVWVSARKNQGQ